MTTRVLLTVDEGPGSLAATRALRAGGYVPYVAVAQDDTYAARSRAAAGVVRVPDPKDEPEAFAHALGSAAQRLHVEAVLPGTEGGLRALAGREQLLPDGVHAGTSPPDIVERALDKTLLRTLAERAGLAVPVTVELDVGAAESRLPEVALPAVVKPAASVLPAADGTFRSLEAERVETEAELRALLARYERADHVVVQQWIDGTLSAACGVAWRGETVCLSHQVSPRIWPPGLGISSFAVTVPADERVERGVRSLVRELEWSGIFGVQFLRDGRDAWLIDVNPRVYGSLQLAVSAGHNLPAIWADLVLGREPRVGPYRVGIGYRVEEDDVRALVRLFRAGRRREALLGALPHARTAHAVLSVRDPAPLLVSGRKLLSRAAAAAGRARRRGSTRAP